MTKEELKQEAEEYVLKKYGTDIGVAEAIHAYIDSAEPREKRIAELEAQIDKMKSDVTTNIKWADQNKNNQMYCKLNSMLNQWR